MDSKFHSIDVCSFAVTLSKLVEDNEKLRRRVDILEETFKDKLASLEQENDTLQKHLSAIISLTESELRKESSETEPEPRTFGSRTNIEYSNEDRRQQPKISQYCKRFRSSNDKILNSHKYRETSHDGRSSSNRYKARDDRRSSSYTKSVDSHSHEVRSSSNRHKARDDRRSSSYTKSVNSHSHDGRLSSNRHKARDERRSGSYSDSGNNHVHEGHSSSPTKLVNSPYEGRTSSNCCESRDNRHSGNIHNKEKSIYESRSRGSSERRKRAHSPREERNECHTVSLSEITLWNEKRNESSIVSLPSSQELTLWRSTGEMHLKKIYSTPMKFISFPDYKLISPLPNTPDQLKEKFKELESKISPVPLLMGENHVFDRNENMELSKRKDIEMKSVDVRTVVKTDDVEHGVFKRKRRT